MTKNLSPDRAPRDVLIAIRLPLIELHRALLEVERRQYEGMNGRVSAAELLQLALKHDQFAWLHQISAIIVRVDELIASDEGPGANTVAVLSGHIRSLLRPLPEGSEFERRYDRAVQEDPAVLLAHGRVIHALPPGSDHVSETVH